MSTNASPNPVPTSIKAWAVMKQGDQDLVPFEFTHPDALAANDVEIQVESCGVCHTDLTMLENGWGMTTFPFVGGHEVIGKVIEVGAKVPSSLHKVGDRVGLGYFSSYCGECDNCKVDLPVICTKRGISINGRHGGFAERVRCGASAAIPIPEGMNPDTAGPLLCAGNTVFTPLVSFDVAHDAKVGIVGIGGLGHLAIKFYKAWGCDVTAFTSSGKYKDAKAMGADQCVNSRDVEDIKKYSNQFDFILYTPDQEGPWNEYIAALKFHGRLNFVGIAPSITASIFSLLAEKSISGSAQCSPARTSEMLQFAAKHQIEPITEVSPMAKINDAFDKLRDGTIRFRGVVKL